MNRANDSASKVTSSFPLVREPNQDYDDLVALDVPGTFMSRSRFTATVFNGSDADPGEFPFSVALFDLVPNGIQGFPDRILKCGGALIHPEWVLTAAHCAIDEGDLALLNRVSLGPEPGHERSIEFRVEHPCYHLDSDNVHQNDLALLKLEEPATSQIAAPVPIASPTTVGNNQKPVVIGWGRMETLSPTNRLQKAPVPLTDVATCRVQYDTVNTSRQFCTDSAQAGPCNLDSGNPLVVNKGGKWKLLGIVSSVQICGKSPALYTNVSAYIPWIEEVTGIEFQD